MSATQLVGGDVRDRDADAGEAAALVEQLLTLNEISEVLNREATFYEAAALILPRLRQLTGAQAAWLFMSRLEVGDPRYATFKLYAHDGLPPALAQPAGEHDAPLPLTTGGCACLTACREGELDRAVDVLRCSRLEAAEHDTAGLARHASIPVTGQRGTLGILNLAMPGDDALDERTLAWLQAVGRSMGTAYERAYLHMQRRCEAESVAAHEERNRVARELHDSATQLLFGAHLALRVAIEHPDADAVRRSAGRGAELVDQALAELRGLVELLRTVDLSEGLHAALVRLVERTSGSVAVHLDGDRADVADADAARALHRIAQEALHNALRHAGATNVWLRVDRDDHELRLQVVDDGRGFPDDLVRGVGLDSMHDRAAAVGARLVLGAREGGGAVVDVRLPLAPDRVRAR